MLVAAGCLLVACLGGSCLGACALVGAGWKWLPACLGARALVVGVLGRFVVGVPLVNVPWSLCPAGWCAWWWLPACLEPCALLVGVVGSWVVTCMPWSLCFLKGSINFIYTNN